MIAVAVERFAIPFCIGILLSAAIVALTPKEKIISMEEDELELSKQAEKLDEQEQTGLSTSQASPFTTDAHLNNNDFTNLKDEYIDNPEAPSGLHRRRKKTVVEHKITSEVAQVLSKKPKLKKFFGVSDESIDTHSVEKKNLDTTNSLTEDQKKELLELLKNQETLPEGESTLLSLVSVLLIIVVVGGGLVLLNIVTNGDFGRIITGLFPVETDALKIKSFLNNFHNRAFHK